MKNKLIQLGLIVALVGMTLMSFNQCQRANAAETDARVLWEDQTELVKTYRDKKGRLTSELTVKTLTNQKLLEDMAEKALEVKRLKGKVQSLTKIKTTTSHTDTIHHTEYLESPGDTIRTDSFIYVYPVYERYGIGDEWFNLDLELGRTTTWYDFKIFNKYTMVHSYKKKLFKRDEIIVTFKSENPYEQEQEIESYSLEKNVPSKWSLGFQGGYGLNKNLEFSPYIGVGINYALVRW